MKTVLIATIGSDLLLEKTFIRCPSGKLLRASEGVEKLLAEIGESPFYVVAWDEVWATHLLFVLGIARERVTFVPIANIACHYYKRFMTFSDLCERWLPDWVIASKNSEENYVDIECSMRVMLNLLVEFDASRHTKPQEFKMCGSKVTLHGMEPNHAVYMNCDNTAVMARVPSRRGSLSGILMMSKFLEKGKQMTISYDPSGDRKIICNAPRLLGHDHEKLSLLDGWEQRYTSEIIGKIVEPFRAIL